MTPDKTCATSCQAAGYNLVVNMFGVESCVKKCPEGFGPDFSD